MNFSEAEEKFNELQARVQRGEPLSEDQYQEELAKLMVQDEHGTFWSLEPGTGRWLYFDGTEWLPGTPPQAAARPPAPPPAPSSAGPTRPMSSADARLTADTPSPVGPSAPEAEAVPTYVRAGEGAEPPERPGGIPPRPVRDPSYLMPSDERPWLPFAIGAIVLLLCALVLFFGVGKLPQFTAAAVRATPTEAPTEEPTLAEEATSEPPTEVAATATKPAPTATASVVTATAKENVRARSGPGTSYGVITTIAKGTSMTVIGRNADNSWFQIQVPGDNQKAWVIKDYIDLKGDLNMVPVVGAPQPTSAPAKASPTKKPAKPSPTATPQG